MKDESLKARAEDLFVVHQLKGREVCTRLGISERTFYNWKKEGEWEKKRAAITSAEEAFHAELFELGKTMARGIRKDIEDGNEVDSSRYYALGRLIETAEKAKKYEKDAPPPSTSAPDLTPEERTQAQATAILKAFGL